MTQFSLTQEDILFLEAKRKRDAMYRQREADILASNEKHKKMMENTDDEYYTPDTQNEAYYLSQYS